MGAVHLTAIRGDNPIGFLAGLGAVRLLSGNTYRAALAWDADAGDCAVIHGPWDSLDQIADELREIAASVEYVLPGIPVDWPPLKAPTCTQLADQPPVAGEWMSALWTDQPTREHQGMPIDVRAAQPAARTPYIALIGAQTVRSFLAKPLAAARALDPDTFARDLTTGVRVKGCTGEQLDAGAYAYADSNDPDAGPAGRPAATWLATMALPLLAPVTTQERRVIAPGWQHIPGTSDAVYTRMVWPLWRQPLNIPATQAIIGGPWMTVHPEWQVDASTYPGLGIYRVCAAKRPPMGTYNQKYLRPLTACPPPEYARMLTAAQVADRVGIGESTWRSYVSRAYAPQADESGRWSTIDVDHWKANRPKQGTRTDLNRPKK